MGKAKADGSAAIRIEHDEPPREAVSSSEPRLTDAMRRRVIALLEAEGVAAKERGQSQRVLAEKLGVSQAAYNRLKNHGQGLGLDFALALRAYFIETGRPMTLDEVLGLEPATTDARTPVDKAYDELLAKYANLEGIVHMLRTKAAVSAKEKAEALDAVGKAKRAVVGTAELRRGR